MEPMQYELKNSKCSSSSLSSLASLSPPIDVMKNSNGYATIMNYVRSLNMAPTHLNNLNLNYSLVQLDRDVLNKFQQDHGADLNSYENLYTNLVYINQLLLQTNMNTFCKDLNEKQENTCFIQNQSKNAMNYFELLFLKSLYEQYSMRPIINKFTERVHEFGMNSADGTEFVDVNNHTISHPIRNNAFDSMSLSPLHLKYTNNFGRSFDKSSLGQLNGNISNSVMQASTIPAHMQLVNNRTAGTLIDPAIPSIYTLNNAFTNPGTNIETCTSTNKHVGPNYFSHIPSQQTNCIQSFQLTHINDEHKPDIKFATESLSKLQPHGKQLVCITNGDMKPVNELTTSDFITSALNPEALHKLIQFSQIVHTLSDLELCWVKLIQMNLTHEKSMISESIRYVFAQSSKRHRLSVGNQEKCDSSKQASKMLWPHFNTKSFNTDKRIEIEFSANYPFYVYGHGWSSACPSSCLKQHALFCRQLELDDICLVMIKRTNVCMKSRGRLNVRVTKTNDETSQTQQSTNLNSLCDSKLLGNTTETSHRQSMGSDETYGLWKPESQTASNQQLQENWREQVNGRASNNKTPKLEHPSNLNVHIKPTDLHPFSAINLAKSPLKKRCCD